MVRPFDICFLNSFYKRRHYVYKLRNGKVYDMQLKEMFYLNLQSFYINEFLGFTDFKLWLKENVKPIIIQDQEVYPLPLAHKIKRFDIRFKAIVQYIQMQDDDNFVILSEKPLEAELEGFWYKLYWSFAHLIDRHIYFIAELFADKRLYEIYDLACSRLVEDK